MGWELFTGKSHNNERLDFPTVRISQARNTTTLNAKAHAHLGMPRRVVLLHDGSRMAIRAAVDTDPPSARYSVTKTRQFSAKSFVVRYDIAPGTYAATVEGDLLVVDFAAGEVQR